MYHPSFKKEKSLDGVFFPFIFQVIYVTEFEMNFLLN